MKCAHEWPFARRSQTEIKSKTKTEHKYKYIKEICLAKEPGGTEAGLATQRLTAGAVKQSRVSECSRLSGGVRRKGRGRERAASVPPPLSSPEFASWRKTKREGKGIAV